MNSPFSWTKLQLEHHIIKRDLDRWADDGGRLPIGYTLDLTKRVRTEENYDIDGIAEQFWNLPCSR